MFKALLKVDGRQKANFMTTIPNPFPDIDRPNRSRVQFEIPTTLYLKLFRKQFPFDGAQNRICGHLLKAFYEQLQQHPTLNSGTFDPDNEPELTKLLLQRCPVAGPTNDGPDSNVLGGNKKLRGKNSRTSKFTTNAESAS